MRKGSPFAALAALFLPAALVYLVGAATRAAVPGMTFDALRVDLNASAAQVAAVASSGVFGCLLFVGFTGFLIDRWGWRRIILPGVVLQVFGEWLLYSQTSLPLVYLGSFLNGGGRTINYLTLLKLLDVEFDRRLFAPLLGVFYIFSYGGTLLGTSSLCEKALAAVGWRTLMQGLNRFTVLCGLLLAVVLLIRRLRPPATESAASVKGGVTLQELGRAFKNAPLRRVFYQTALNIFVYWSILAVVAKKYLADLCGIPPTILGTMNILVIVEMVLGGTVSYWFGNRRRGFQIVSAAALTAGIASLFVGAFAVPNLTRVLATVGFLALGVGYGFTGVTIAALREQAPDGYSASVIGLANFVANISLIAIMQLGGWLFDCFAVESHSLAVAPYGYQILLGIYLVLTLPVVFCASLKS